MHCLAASAFDASREPNAQFIEHKQRRHHGEGRDNGIGDGRDQLGKGEQSKVGEPALRAQQSRGHEMQVHQHEHDDGQLKRQPTDQDLPFAHFGSSFPRIGSLILKNKELPMLVLSYCGQLPIWQTKDLKIL